MWMVMAFLSAFFAGITSILAKLGIHHTDSDVATAIRTMVVLLFSIGMVMITDSFSSITEISFLSLCFLILSGLATGMSWICYFKALSMGDVNKVVVIDKTSSVFTVLLAIVLFQEYSNWIGKLIGIFFVGIGTLLIIERKDGGKSSLRKKGWLFYACLSSVFATLTSLLAKIGIHGVESNLATMIRTFVVLIMAWWIVHRQGKMKLVKQLEQKELWFLLFSGISTGASWLCYYYALANGDVSIVVPIDKLSVFISVLFSLFVCQEKLSKKAYCGLFLLLLGTLLMCRLS